MYMDGCFDVMHYGHANALRQARALGDQLVLGLISDDEIRRAKGPPVMNYKERKTLVGANKWVDEVIDGEPFLFSDSAQASQIVFYGVRPAPTMVAHLASKGPPGCRTWQLRFEQLGRGGQPNVWLLLLQTRHTS